MCELFGASFSRPIKVNEELKKFYAHSTDHPHGWGIMRMNEETREIIKEPVCAVRSQIIEGVIDSTEPQKNILAHIRYATVGSLSKNNCHPFTGTDISGREWTLIHNGTMYSGMDLLKYVYDQEGETDSERFFMYLLDNINSAIAQYGILSERDRFELIENIVCYMTPRNKLNLMIFDGDVLYVHKNMRHTLYYKKVDGGMMFVTRPLDEDWQKFPLCRVRAYKNGRLRFDGQKKTTEFISALDNISTTAGMNI